MPANNNDYISEEYEIQKDTQETDASGLINMNAEYDLSASVFQASMGDYGKNKVECDLIYGDAQYNRNALVFQASMGDYGKLSQKEFESKLSELVSSNEDAIRKLYHEMDGYMPSTDYPVNNLHATIRLLYSRSSGKQQAKFSNKISKLINQSNQVVAEEVENKPVEKTKGILNSSMGVSIDDIFDEKLDIEEIQQKTLLVSLLNKAAKREYIYEKNQEWDKIESAERNQKVKFAEEDSVKYFKDEDIIGNTFMHTDDIS